VPVAIVEGNRPGRNEISRLLVVAGPSTPEAEVLDRVVRIPEVEAPAEIEEKTLASRACAGGGILA